MRSGKTVTVILSNEQLIKVQHSWGDCPVSADRPVSFRFTLALLLFILCLTSPTWADYEAGMEAYQRRDYATALHEWLPLAEQGHADAQYKLGVLYNFRKGVPQDFTTARQWYEKAAAQGHARAQNNLGELYQFGHGVTRNYVLAYMWYDVAATHSTDDAWRDIAVENRAEIAGRMTSAQIAEAQQRAQEWRPKDQ
jgi:TPR repeat protein